MALLLASTALLAGCRNDAQPQTAPSFQFNVRAATVTERGAQASVRLALSQRPAGRVVVTAVSLDPSEGTVANGPFVFTPENWNAPQELRVNGVDDPTKDGDQSFQVEVSVSESEDARFGRMLGERITLTTRDDETAGFTVSAVAGAASEQGGQATFTVVLDAAPLSNVTVDVTSGRLAEATVSPATLTFTSANWNAPQSVTVTGVNDDVADGAQALAVTLAARSSALGFEALPAQSVALSNADDDTASIVVGDASGATGESGAQASFTVALGSQPTGTVVLHPRTSDATEGTLSTDTLTFTPANWRAPQAVTVTGVNDDVADGAQPYEVRFTETVSSDTAYAALVARSVGLSNTDDDSAGITVSAVTGEATEAGGQARFGVALNSEPTADVTVHLASTDATEGRAGVSSLTFTPVNWKAAQQVLVTGQPDDVADGNQPFAVRFGATASQDAAYAALVPADVLLSNRDDDTAGFVVGAVSGATSEAGGQATFTLALQSEPTADVTVHFASSDATEGAATASSLTFTAANWKAPQTVRVTGQNDDVADGAQPYAVAFGATTSADTAYAALKPGNVALSNTDDDSAGITVSAASGDTTEAGTQATFTVVLTSEPTADVTVHVTSTDAGEGTLSTDSLTFTPANWKAPQAVTVTGQQDDLADGRQAFAARFSATTSADAAYAALTPADVALATVDDDSAGITVSAVSGPTTEGGGQAELTVVLHSEPYADVTVRFASSDPTEGATNVTSLTFTPANWKAPQSVRLMGQNDDVADGDQPYAIVFSATTSADAAYAALTPASVDASNTDDDSAGIKVTAVASTSDENGAQAELTVVLTSEPTADVTVHFDTSDATEGTVTATSLTFTPVNWAAPQQVLVTGQDDAVADGDQPYAITFGATSSGDAAYAALRPGNVSLTNTDDDSAGITVSDVTGTPTEAGGTATFTVVLTSEPTADVTVSFDSDDATEGTVAEKSLTFTAQNWAAPQAVAVTGVNDALADGNQPFAVVFSATSSADAKYAVLTPANVALTTTDDDSAGITVSAISGNTSEAGGTATFTLVLTSQPFADVTVSYGSNDTTEGTTSTASRTFTPANWSQPQTVTVTGVNDALADGHQPYAIVFSATTSTDPAYAVLRPANVAVTNVDNDTAGITVGAASRATTEAGLTATVPVVLTSEPTANVTVNFDSNDVTEGTVAVKSLTFTPANWNVSQNVVVTGVDDLVMDGNQPYALVFSATTSADAAYASLRPANVALSNTDNDVAAIRVVQASGVTTESGGTSTFTVVLGSQPTANVAVAITSLDTTEGTVSTGSLTFTPANWSTAQTVTVTGAADGVVDGDQAYVVKVGPVTSSDPAYAAIDPADVSLVNRETIPVLYQAGFTAGTLSSSSSQCTNWTSFRSRLTSTYSKITINGSNDPTGKTCTGATANQLCQALRAGTGFSASCNGEAWYVGSAGACGADSELAIGEPCSCGATYAVRPCINNNNWGGVGTATCSSPSQTMTVACE